MDVVPRIARVHQLGARIGHRNAGGGRCGYPGEFREENGGCAGGCNGGRRTVGNCEARNTFTVKITRCERNGCRAGGKRRFHSECSVAFTEKHGYGICAAVGDSEIDDPISIEVSQGDGRELNTSRWARIWCEVAVTSAEQDGDIVVSAVGDGEVGFTVAVEVADGDCGGRFSSVDAGSGEEVSEAILKKDLHGAIAAHDGKIQRAASGEISSAESGYRRIGRRIERSRVEGSVAVTQEDIDYRYTKTFAGYDEVLLAVAVEVASDEGADVDNSP